MNSSVYSLLTILIYTEISTTNYINQSLFIFTSLYRKYISRLPQGRECLKFRFYLQFVIASRYKHIENSIYRPQRYKNVIWRLKTPLLMTSSPYIVKATKVGDRLEFVFNVVVNRYWKVSRLPRFAMQILFGLDCPVGSQSENKLLRLG